MRKCENCKLITDIWYKNICYYCINVENETAIQTEKIDKPKKKRNGICNEKWV